MTPVRRRTRPALAVVAALALAGTAGAAQPWPAPYEESVVDVTVNGEALPAALVVRRDVDGTLLLRAADLATLRLRTPSTGGIQVNGERYYRIGREIGATVTFDEATQSVDVVLPPQAFEATRRESRASTGKPPPVRTQPGAFLNYDASAQRAGDQASGGGFLELGVFGARGVVTGTALAQVDAQGARGARLDTAWTRDFPDRLLTLRLGDSVSTAGAWGRSVRFGGVQFGTNFSTQPTLVTTPLLSTGGDAVVPSTVDIFVNGQHVASEQVKPGPFQIEGVPAIDGAGQMQVVVTDALGRQQVISQPYYSGSTLLRPGLDEYSVEAGAVRRNYTTASNDYGGFVTAATFRRGLSGSLTVGAHAEAGTGGAAAAGIDGSIRAGTLGVVTVAAAAGGDSASRGWLGSLGFERSGTRMSVTVRGQYSSQGFVQLGDDGLASRSKLRAFGALGLNLEPGGSVQLAYGRQASWRGPALETWGLGYSLGLGTRGFVSLLASRATSGTSSTDVFLTWTLPLGERRSASTAFRRSTGSTGSGRDFEAVGSVQHYLPAGTGSGYSASISSADEAHLGYAFQGPAGTVSVDVARAYGQDGVRIGATGGVAVTGFGVMPSRRLDRSFAVVRLADYPGIEVFLDNQPIGRTDARGRVLLDDLLPYQENRVSVDPNRLPADATVSTSSMTVTPAYRSGLAVEFPISRADAVTLQLVQPGVGPVPPGAEVELGDQSFPVGMQGSVFLSGVSSQRVTARATWRDGRCSFQVARPAGADPLPDLGAVPCVPATQPGDDP